MRTYSTLTIGRTLSYRFLAPSLLSISSVVKQDIFETPGSGREPLLHFRDVFLSRLNGRAAERRSRDSISDIVFLLQRVLGTMMGILKYTRMYCEI
jgi:hypothetical protein